MKTTTAKLIISLVLVVSFISGSVAAVSEFKPLDLCIVLDKSWSMNETMGDGTKLDGAKKAAKDVISVLLPEDRISVVSFAGTATTEIGFTSNFEEAKRRIDRINFDSSTSFGAGLSAALNQFDSRGTSDHISAILFMSDGGHNTQPDPYSYVVQCDNREIPIFTVGFAETESQVDVENLTMMSSATDGEYVFVDDIFDLENAFLELHNKASDFDPISEYMGKVSPGRTAIAGTFEVAAYMACLRVTLNWPGSDMDLILFDPSGQEVDFNSPDIVYSRDTKPEYVIISDPDPGTWTAMVHGKELDHVEDFYLLTSSYEPIDMMKTGQGESILQTSDGGYVIAGWTEPKHRRENVDIRLIKINSRGFIEWDQSLNSFANPDFSVCPVIQTFDGGYLVAAGCYLYKTDSHGNIELPLSIGGYIQSLQQTPKGEYVLAGTTRLDDDTEKAYLVVCDEDWASCLEETIGRGDDYDIKSVQQACDLGYVIVGTKDGRDICLIKTDSFGRLEWERIFDKSGKGDGGSLVQQTSDGGYIIVGNAFSDHSSRDAWLIKTDSNGNLMWDRTFGGSGCDGGHSVKQTSDGGYIITGFIESDDDSCDEDVWLIKTDSNGYVMWDQIFDNSNSDDEGGHSVKQTSDGGYIIVGWTWFDRIWVIKTDSNGNKIWDVIISEVDDKEYYVVDPDFCYV